MEKIRSPMAITKKEVLAKLVSKMEVAVFGVNSDKLLEESHAF
jgi:hypothetical protein